MQTRILEEMSTRRQGVPSEVLNLLYCPPLGLDSLDSYKVVQECKADPDESVLY